MSKVWRRLQRVGKTAYKFEFTIKVHTVTLECVSGWTPNQVSVLWARRGRKVRTKATSWTTLPGKDTQGVVHWQALEATTTLYMDTNSHKKKFDDKYWTLIIENVGANGKHKALAKEQVNMSEFADVALRGLETRRKYRMKPATSKVHLTELQVTFISKFERQGPAIDDDMRSVTSEMSEMTFGGFEDGYMSENEFDNYTEANVEENEQIMREIAAIGADFRQLSSFSTEDPNGAPPLPANSSQTNGVPSHEQILIAWARKETEDYTNISIVDMTDSWGDGSAFCAIIHKYCPELIKMGQLNDPYSNVKQATKASVELGLMPSIDPIDFHKGRLDKLSILTFVDQLHQRFKNAQPQTITVMKHKELKKSPEHRRKTASVLSNKRLELDDSEEEKRRRDMIARGRLRASKRRPNAQRNETSIDAAKSPIPTPSINLSSHPRSPVPDPAATSPETTKLAPSAPPLEDEESVTGSSGVITDSSSPLVKCNVTSSFEADVFVTSGADVFVTSGGGLDPEELMREFQRQSPAVSSRVDDNEVDVFKREIEKNKPSESDVMDQLVINAIIGSEEGSLDHVFEKSAEFDGRMDGSGDKVSLNSLDQQSALSADAILQSLEAEVIHSPSSIKISGIQSEDAALDPTALAIKLNESKDGAALVREAILSGEGGPGRVVADPVKEPELEPVVDDFMSDFDELIKIKFSIDEPAVLVPIDVIEEPIKEDAAEETSFNDIESDIEAEIAALEHQLDSNFLFKSQPTVLPPLPSPKPSPSAAKEEPTVREPVPTPRQPTPPLAPLQPTPPLAPLQPTPPLTPPPIRRGSSLRDKIRGLHDAREKLMSACPSPAIAESNRETKVKPPVFPKPTDRALSLSREKIALLRSNSQESDRSRSSSKSDCMPVIPAVQLVEPPVAASVGEGLSPDTPPVSPETAEKGVVKVEGVTEGEGEVSLEEVKLQVSQKPESPESSSVTPTFEYDSPRTSSESSDDVMALEPPRDVTTPPREVTTPPRDVTTPPRDVTTPPLCVASPKPTITPRKPKGPELQSLSELISSFSPKTEAETSYEQTTTVFTSGSRGTSPTNEGEVAGSRDNVTGSRDNVRSCDDLRDTGGFRSNKDFGSSVSSVSSEPPPPPAPEPLAMMMGPTPDEDSPVEEEEEESDDDTLDQNTLDKQDLQDVRNYISECHTRITHHNAKLDKKAKVLEKELRVAMDSQNHELEQKLLKSWLHLVHERNTLVRKQDELNSLQNEEDLEETCCVVLKQMRRYQNMRDTEKTVHDVEREEQLEDEYRELLKKREMLLRIRDDINSISMEEEAEFRSVIEKPKLLQDQSSCKVS